MSLAEWQIAATVVVGVGSPFVAAQLAVRRLGHELDNARLDELRGVLDETVVALARAVDLQTDALHALRAEPNPDLHDHEAVISELIVLYARIHLRIGEHVVTGILGEALKQSQAVHLGLMSWAGDSEHARQELRTARHAVTEAYATFLEEARVLVGASDQALARLSGERRSIRRPNPPELTMTNEDENKANTDT